MRALILAGGLGKRLAPLTQEVPKPLIPIAGKPILVRQIEWLRGQGIYDFVIAVGYLRHKIFEALGDGRKYGVRIFYSVEEEPLGTGGAIKNAEPYLDDVFIAINGDILTNLSIKPLLDALSDADAAIALVPLRSPYGVVEFDDGGYIRAFREKPVLEDYYINAGVYVMRREMLKSLPDRGNIEETAFPELAKRRRLKAVLFKDVLWRSIDTLKDLEEMEKALSSSE